MIDFPRSIPCLFRCRSGWAEGIPSPLPGFLSVGRGRSDSGQVSIQRTRVLPRRRDLSSVARDGCPSLSSFDCTRQSPHIPPRRFRSTVRQAYPPSLRQGKAYSAHSGLPKPRVMARCPIRSNEGIFGQKAKRLKVAKSKMWWSMKAKRRPAVHGTTVAADNRLDGAFQALKKISKVSFGAGFKATACAGGARSSRDTLRTLSAFLDFSATPVT